MRKSWIFIILSMSIFIFGIFNANGFLIRYNDDVTTTNSPLFNGYWGYFDLENGHYIRDINFLKANLPRQVAAPWPFEGFDINFDSINYSDYSFSSGLTFNHSIGSINPYQYSETNYDEDPFNLYNLNPHSPINSYYEQDQEISITCSDSSVSFHNTGYEEQNHTLEYYENSYYLENIRQFLPFLYTRTETQLTEASRVPLFYSTNFYNASEDGENFECLILVYDQYTGVCQSRPEYDITGEIYSHTFYKGNSEYPGSNFNEAGSFDFSPIYSGAFSKKGEFLGPGYSFNPENYSWVAKDNVSLYDIYSLKVPKEIAESTLSEAIEYGDLDYYDYTLGCHAVLSGEVKEIPYSLYSSAYLGTPAIKPAKIELEDGNSNSFSVNCSLPDESASARDSRNFKFRLRDGAEVIQEKTVSFTDTDNMYYVFENKANKESGLLRCEVFELTGENIFISNWMGDFDLDNALSYYQFESATEISISGDRFLGEYQYLDNINTGIYLVEPDTQEFLENYKEYIDYDDWFLDDNNDFPNRLGGREYEIEKCIESFDELKILRESGIEFNLDKNNNGIKDHNYCAYFRTPIVYDYVEEADDIDGNFVGSCQANSSVSCNIYWNKGVKYDDGNVFKGDGANSADCEGLINPWGVADSFCQMVDERIEVDGEVCDGYTRVVKYATKSNQNKQTLSAFVPGGKKINTFYTSSQNYLGIGDAGNSENALCGVYMTNQIGQLVFDSSPCLAISESGGKKRSSENLPEEYIDSFRGELNFKGFYDIEGNSDSEGLDKEFVWKEACVLKDKCMDGGDNDGSESLNKALPYGYFLKTNDIAIDTNDDDIIDKTVKSDDFFTKLIDVDDPECKYESPYEISPDMSISKSNEGKEFAEYKENPATGKPYCLDEDKDGFCACSPESIENGECKTDFIYGIDSQDFSPSKQFPDCDDNPSNPIYNDLPLSVLSPWGVEYSIGVATRTNEDPNAWSLSNKNFNSWFVHPLTPVVFDDCVNSPTKSNSGSDVNIDFNCNKNLHEGYNLQLLTMGETPFDYDAKTGSEYLHVAPGTNPLGTDTNLDLVCYDETRGKMIKVAKTGAIIAAVGYAATIVGPSAASKIFGVIAKSPTLVTVFTVGDAYFTLDQGENFINSLADCIAEKDVLGIDYFENGNCLNALIDGGFTALGVGGLKQSVTVISRKGVRVITAGASVDDLADASIGKIKTIKKASPEVLDNDYAAMSSVRSVQAIERPGLISNFFGSGKTGLRTVTCTDQELLARNYERAKKLLFPELYTLDIQNGFIGQAIKNEGYDIVYDFELIAANMKSGRPASILREKLVERFPYEEVKNSYLVGLSVPEEVRRAYYESVLDNYLAKILNFQVDSSVLITKKHVTDLAHGISPIDESELDAFIADKGRFTSEGCPGRGKVCIVKKYDESAGAHYRRENRIEITEHNLRSQVFTHEFGHHVNYQYFDGEAALVLARLYSKDHNLIKKISGYAVSDELEVFAEAYAYWKGFNANLGEYVGVQQGRNLLKQRHPEVHKFFIELEQRGVLKGRVTTSPDEEAFLKNYYNAKAYQKSYSEEEVRKFIEESLGREYQEILREQNMRITALVSTGGLAAGAVGTVAYSKADIPYLISAYLLTEEKKIETFEKNLNKEALDSIAYSDSE